MFPDDVLSGQKVRLRQVTESDLASFVHWLNDPASNAWLAMPESGPKVAKSRRNAANAAYFMGINDRHGRGGRRSHGQAAGFCRGVAQHGSAPRSGH